MKGVHRLRPLPALLVLACLLCAPWSVEAGSGAPAEATSSLRVFLDWLTELWGDNGCTFDPSGGCRDAAGGGLATDSGNIDAGCTFDPSGSACGQAPNLDNGCSFDPNGGGCRGDR